MARDAKTPKPAKKKETLIINVEKQTTYSSVAEAARAIGVDPSNVRAMLKGKRRTVGGYTFVQWDKPTIKEKELQSLPEWAHADRTAREEARAAKLREQQRQRVQQRGASAAGRKPKLSPEIKKARQEAHDAMVKANALMKRLRKSGKHKAALESLESIAQSLGASKTGLFDTKPKSIAGVSQSKREQEQKKALEQLTNRITQIQQQMDTRDAKRQALYGMQDTKEAEQKRDVLDKLDEVMGRIGDLFPRVNGRSKYQDFWDEVRGDVTDLTVEDIEDMVQTLTDYLDSDREKSTEELNRIYEDWRESMGLEDEEGGEEDDYEEISFT